MTCRTTIGLTLFMLTAALVRGTPDDRAPVPEPRDDTDRQYVAPRPLSASDLASEAGAYYGRVVRVRSQVTLPLGPHAFVLSDEPLLAAPRVVVLVPQPLAPAAQDYMMNVVGTVGPFNPRDLRREYPWFNAALFDGTDLWAHGAQDGTSVIIAQSVRTEADLELVQLPAVGPSAAGSFGAGQTGIGQGSKAPPPVTRLGTIFRSDNATALAGSPIDLAAARVQRVFDPEFIAVGRDIQHSILVRLAEPTPSIVAGDTVALSGIIEKSPESWPDRTVTQLLPVCIYARHVAPVTH